MKEATGELNMTVVTVVAIAAVGGFFYLFIWPGIQAGLATNTCKNICPGVDSQYSSDIKATKDEDGNYKVCQCSDNKGGTYEMDMD